MSAIDFDDYGDHVECWQCGGEGTITNCFEEFACIDPEDGCPDCWRRCDICGGKGSWLRPDAPSPVHDGTEAGS